MHSSHLSILDNPVSSRIHSMCGMVGTIYCSSNVKKNKHLSCTRTIVIHVVVDWRGIHGKYPG